MKCIVNHSKNIARYWTTLGSAIKPLFRDSDRAAMLAVFDLWSLDDVRSNAD
jgi:hypothetical protein